MATIIESRATWKEEKIDLKKALSSLEESMLDYKEKRKSEWRSFKDEFHTEQDKIKKTIKKMISEHKKS
ncbi:MAG: hypothetical protein WCL00_06835 [Bacteroidota bacterium]